MSLRLETLIREATKQERQTSRNTAFAEISHNIDSLWLDSREAGVEEKFLESLHVQLPRAEQELPTSLKLRGETVYGRQQPSLPEAIRETVKRLKFVKKFTSHLPDSVHGVIVGGSLSYGRFYNLRGQPNPSDVDIFLVVDEGFFDSDDGASMISSKNNFSKQAVDDYSVRADAFKNMLIKGEADLMSIKTMVDDFLASVKIIPIKMFKDEFDTQLELATQSNTDRVVAIRDYKQGPYPNRTFVQYDFLHEPFYFDIGEDYPSTGGAITALPLLIVKGGRLYTGQHHNHVIPRMEIEFDRDGRIAEILYRFSQHLKSRFISEKKQAPYSHQMRLLNCHDRRDILPPYLSEHARFFEEG